MKGHPTDEALLAHCEAATEDQWNPDVKSHLDQGCGRCVERVGMFREILNSLHVPRLEEAPMDLVQTALARIEESEARRAPAQKGVRDALESSLEKVRRSIREIQMRLVLDSRIGGALVGIRGTTTLQPRQLLFESPEGSVHLRIEKGSRRRYELMGQFLPAEGEITGTSKVVLEGEGRPTRRSLSGTGEFRFASVAAGRIRLRVEHGDAILTAGPLDLSEDADA